jgi:hypothetical protein
MSNYPTLRLGVLQGLAGLKASFDADQTYLRKPDCPYDNDTVDLLEKLFKAREIEVIKEVVVDKPERGKVGRPSSKKELNDDDAAEVEAEAKEMLKELRTLDKDAGGEMKQLDTATKLSILKTRSTLLEKLVTIRERFTSARKVAEFQQIVISILDDLVDEERRAEFIERLEPYRS